MPEAPKRLIVGFTGAFGSGCTLVATEFFQKDRGCALLSLSVELKVLFQERHGREHKNRRELQDFGNELRRERPSILADIVIGKIEELAKDTNIAVDSIRNPAEINAFRKKYPEFYLVALFADYDKRWSRVKSSYNDSKDLFDDDEFKDQGSKEPEYGQKVSKCFFEADLILSNNEDINSVGPNDAYRKMSQKINHYLMAFGNPTVPEPTMNESLMAIAYTIGRRSKCIKRRVGAIIVDENYNIISSGFNGVPTGLDDCINQHGECYRDTYRRKLKEGINKQISLKAPPSVIESEIAGEIAGDIVDKIKVLELCRALHAEESSIMNLVGRTAQALADSTARGGYDKYTLYATTYPCNLCANKIVQSGIKKVVYYEPYPVEEAKKIFQAGGVRAEPFEGVTFRAFFRAFDYEP